MCGRAAGRAPRRVGRPIFGSSSARWITSAGRVGDLRAGAEVLGVREHGAIARAALHPHGVPGAVMRRRTTAGVSATRRSNGPRSRMMPMFISAATGE